MFISRHYTDLNFSKPLSINDAITIYADQVWGWFFDIAERLTKDIEADFVTLMIIAAYFEGHEIFWQGKEGKSGEFFKAAFKRIVPICLGSRKTDSSKPEDAREEIANTLWSQMRCGLFHAGMTRRQIQLNRGTINNPIPPVVAEKQDGEWIITINVPALFTVIKEHFREYVGQFRDPSKTDLHKNFVKSWNMRINNDTSNPLFVFLGDQNA